MTRKHFIALANALYAQKPTCGNKARLKQWEACVEAVAGVCAQFNTALNKHKWLKLANGKSANITGKWTWIKKAIPKVAPAPADIDHWEGYAPVSASSLVASTPEPAGIQAAQQATAGAQALAAAEEPTALVGTIDNLIEPF